MSYRLPETVQGHTNGIDVVVDPRIELLAVVQSISSYAKHFPFLLNQHELAYKSEVLAHFEAWRDHDVIAWLDDISVQPGMYNFGAPPTSMLYLDHDLRLRKDALPDTFTINRAGGIDEFRRFAGMLGDFGAHAGFRDFFTNRGADFGDLVQSVATTLTDVTFVAQLESFYGTRQASYTLILAPLYGPVGFGPLVRTPYGATHVYSILGPRRQQDDAASFGDRAYFRYMQQHEFSHSFVNPLTEKHAELVQQYEYRFAHMPPYATQNICGDWEECVNEQIIRAITTHFAFEAGEEMGRAALAAEKGRGLPFVEGFLDGIRDYAASRDTYPTLDDYYPRLLATLHG